MDDYKTRMEKVVEQKTRSIKELPEEILEMFIEIPEEGLKYHDFMNNEGIAEPLIKEGDYVNIHRIIGNYGTNNGMMSFVTPDRKTYVGPLRSDAVEALKDAGYEEGLTVPLSAGRDEKLDDPKMEEKMQFLKIQRDEYMAKAQIEKFTQEVADIATAKGLAELPKEFYGVCQQITPEGLKTKRLGKESSKVKAFFDPLDKGFVNQRHPMKDYIGSYNYNGGTTVFVDMNGETWITPFHHDAVKFLEAAGYKRNINMPALMDNMDEFADEEISERYENLRANSKIREEEKSRFENLSPERHLEDFAKAVEYMENPDLEYSPNLGYRL